MTRAEEIAAKKDARKKRSRVLSLLYISSSMCFIAAASSLQIGLVISGSAIGLYALLYLLFSLEGDL